MKKFSVFEDGEGWLVLDESGTVRRCTLDIHEATEMSYEDAVKNLSPDRQCNGRCIMPAWSNWSTDEVFTFNRGDLVSKVGGDYSFDGTVLCAFRKLSGKVRFGVEDDRGVIHIFSDKNLKPRD